jgi:hypothetical protein
MPAPPPTTIAELCELPGWTIDHDPGDPDSVPGATWTGHGVAVTIRWDGDYECWEATAGDAIPVTYDHLGPAMRFALDLVAVIATAADHALAAAAPLPPPTTIAELATRPGWRLDDGDAIHDETDTIATLLNVCHAGDQFWPGDERACAEAAYAVAAAAEGSQARAAANPDQE